MAKFPFGMTNMYLPSKIEVRLTLFACAHLPSLHSPLLALRLYRLTNALKYSRDDDQSTVLLASSKFFSCFVSVTNSYVSAAIQDIGASSYDMTVLWDVLYISVRAPLDWFRHILAASRSWSRQTGKYSSASLCKRTSRSDVSYARVSHGHFLGCRAHSFW